MPADVIDRRRADASYLNNERNSFRIIPDSKFLENSASEAGIPIRLSKQYLLRLH
jgi:hypothetical protein